MSMPTNENINSEVAERATWIRPEVRTLSAGAAELAVGKIDDGVDFS
jgi:hypothetical protein